ncbi:MAG: hypothetical protein OXC91_09195, partial [Rhodobacteraceae bacterium]|nr:hypothetical protein [Paracoccaceae bacterium]
MSLAGDFIRFHHQPGAVFRHRLATSSESDAFAVLILALLISFLGRIPGVALTSQSSGAALAPSLAATFVGGVLFGALFFYAL